MGQETEAHASASAPPSSVSALLTRDEAGNRPEPGSRVPAGGQIGRYVVLREIGSGGMGVVLAAYDPDLDRKVAVKILQEGVRHGSAGAVRMRREAQAMARVSHPNVAHVYEVAEDRGRLFLAMEYIAGQTLREWRNAAPRAWREVLRVYEDPVGALLQGHPGQVEIRIGRR